LLDNKLPAQGIYGQRLAEIYALLAPNWQVLQQVYPPARASMLFETKAADCIVPADIKGMVDQEHRLISKPFSYASAYIFTRLDQPVVYSLNELEGLVVDKRLGLTYGGIASDNINFVSVSSIKQNLDMLYKHRIDAFIAYEPDISLFMAEHPEYQVHRAEEFIIHRQAEAMVCHKQQKTQAFLKSFNEKVYQLGVAAQIDQDFSRS
jgi:ABC-type amino acid transport substrate-binding protein